MCRLCCVRRDGVCELLAFERTNVLYNVSSPPPNRIVQAYRILQLARRPFVVHIYVFQRFGPPKFNALSTPVLVPSRFPRLSSNAVPRKVGRDAAVFVGDTFCCRLISRTHVPDLAALSLPVNKSHNLTQSFASKCERMSREFAGASNARRKEDRRYRRD